MEEWEKSVELRRKFIDGSDPFVVKIYPFKHGNVPKYYCNGGEFKLEVTFNDAGVFINHLGVESKQIRLAIRKIDLFVDEAEISPETNKRLAVYDFSTCRVFPWDHHYIDSEIIKVGKGTFYKTQPLLTSGSTSKAYIVVVRDPRQSASNYMEGEDQKGPLNYSSFNLNQIKVLEDDEVVGMPIRSNNTTCIIGSDQLYSEYRMFSWNRKRELVSQTDFCRDSTVFIFKRGNSETPAKARPVIELLFRDIPNRDLEVIIMACEPESYEIYGWGDIRNLKQLTEIPESMDTTPAPEKKPVAAADEPVIEDNEAAPPPTKKVAVETMTTTTINSETKRGRGRPSKQLQ